MAAWASGSDARPWHWTVGRHELLFYLSPTVASGFWGGSSPEPQKGGKEGWPCEKLRKTGVGRTPPMAVELHLKTAHLGMKRAGTVLAPVLPLWIPAPTHTPWCPHTPRRPAEVGRSAALEECAVLKTIWKWRRKMSQRECGCQGDRSKYTSFPKRLQTIVIVDHILTLKKRHKNAQDTPKIKCLGDHASVYLFLHILLTQTDTNVYINEKVGNEFLPI